MIPQQEEVGVPLEDSEAESAGDRGPTSVQAYVYVYVYVCIYKYICIYTHMCYMHICECIHVCIV